MVCVSCVLIIIDVCNFYHFWFLIFCDYCQPEMTRNFSFFSVEKFNVQSIDRSILRVRSGVYSIDYQIQKSNIYWIKWPSANEEENEPEKKEKKPNKFFQIKKMFPEKCNVICVVFFWLNQDREKNCSTLHRTVLFVDFCRS